MQNSVLTRIVVVLLGLLLVPSSVAALTFANSTTVGYYKFEEASSPYASEVSTADLVAASSPTQVSGIIGFGQQGSGTQCPSATIADYSNLGASFSVNHWVKSPDPGSSYATMWYRGTWGNAGAIGARSESPGTPGKISFEQYSLSSNSLHSATTSILNDDQWHMVTYVVDGTSGDRYIYLDGVLDSTSSFTGTNPTLSATWSIFCRNNADRYFSGIIDEFSIHDSALTADNVTFLYNGGAPTVAQQYPYPVVSPNQTVTNGTSNIIGAPPGFLYNLTYDASTKIVNYNWSDQYFTMNNSRLDIRYFGGGQYILNTSQQNSSNPGVITANISNLVDQNFTVRALAYLTDNNRTFLSGNTTLINQLWIYPTPVINASTFTIDEPEGVFWGAMIVGTMIIMSAVNPPVAIIAGVTGLFFTSLFGFIALQLETLFLVALLAGILIWRMRR